MPARLNRLPTGCRGAPARNRTGTSRLEGGGSVHLSYGSGRASHTLTLEPGLTRTLCRKIELAVGTGLGQYLGHESTFSISL